MVSDEFLESKYLTKAPNDIKYSEGRGWFSKEGYFWRPKI